MNNDGKLFSDELTNCMIDEGSFKQPQFKSYIYYKYAPDESKLVVLPYVNGCVYWYNYEEIGNWSVDKIVDIPGNTLHVKFLGYAHWFMSIMISQLKDHSISVAQYIYVTYVVEKYLETSTKKENSKFHKTTLPHDMIFTKEDDYSSG